MALVYFDASALVKLCVPEAGSGLASRLWNRADVVVTSRLADVEVRAALAAGLRAGVIDEPGHGRAVGVWEVLAPALHVVELSGAVADRASRLVASGSMRSNDAVHVASALAVTHADTIVAAWDPHVVSAARSVGLRVVPWPLARP
ncbi:type II toxin-antitoxin system VapC family toxin [Cellulosimicrobium protaetiae]|uniref:Type II toxin-antitoxin system VapC family toxin n=1 Tax=Cellulosimicrobium protaetiae TaxID=2587808 RepID=A0A6M5UEQ1_9MICO|nr:type II toxin-antitoxin system VapC family toxin [Cellulosimicrobium protaetiae]QJW35745.1 type II toxin-antitoxin system VapC family toxin [Cellulosimicrobium protaetiae]